MSKAQRTALWVVVALLIVFAIGLFARARATDCTEGTITWTETTPGWSPTHEAQGVYTAIVGTFLWAYFGPEAPADWLDPEILSLAIPPGSTGATLCQDGLVTFRYPSLEESYPTIPQPVNIIDYWADWASQDVPA